METNAEISPVKPVEKKYTVREVLGSLYYTLDLYDENEITDGSIYLVSTLDGQHTSIRLSNEELEALKTSNKVERKSDE